MAHLRRIVVVAVLVIPLQAAAEEYVTRGWLVQTLAVWTPVRWLAVAPGVAVFVVLHGPPGVWVAADLTVFAVACCWITFRTGGLEAAVVLHAVTNILVSPVTGSQGLVEPAADHPDLSAVEVLPGMLVAPLYAWCVATRTGGGRARPRRGGAPLSPAGPTP